MCTPVVYVVYCLCAHQSHRRSCFARVLLLPCGNSMPTVSHLLPTLTIADLDPKFCELAAAAFGASAAILQSDLAASGCNCLVHPGNPFGHVASSLDRRLVLDLFGPPYQHAIQQLVDNYGGGLPFGSAHVVATGHPQIRWCVYAVCFPFRQGIPHTALLASLEAVARHNANAPAANDMIRSLASPGLGLYLGCSHLETTATQMALAARTARDAAGESSCQAHGPPGGVGGDGGGGAAGSSGCDGGASTTSSGTDMSATGSRSSMETNGMTETTESSAVRDMNSQPVSRLPFHKFIGELATFYKIRLAQGNSHTTQSHFTPHSHTNTHHNECRSGPKQNCAHQSSCYPYSTTLSNEQRPRATRPQDAPHKSILHCVQAPQASSVGSPLKTSSSDASWLHSIQEPS